MENTSFFTSSAVAITRGRCGHHRLGTLATWTLLGEGHAGIAASIGSNRIRFYWKWTSLRIRPVLILDNSIGIISARIRIYHIVIVSHFASVYRESWLSLAKLVSGLKSFLLESSWEISTILEVTLINFIFFYRLLLTKGLAEVNWNFNWM